MNETFWCPFCGKELEGDPNEHLKLHQRSLAKQFGYDWDEIKKEKEKKI